MKKIYFVIFGIVLVVSILAVLFLRIDSKIEVYDFDSCVNAGYPVLESYPEQCTTPNGNTYVKEIEKAFNYSEGLILMQNKDTKEFACFGCGDFMCIDPAPIMETIIETDDIYCDNNFSVIRKEEIKIQSDFGNKIVYSIINEYYSEIDFQKDCQSRGGTYNSCGSVCANDADACIMMCGFTCENLS